MMYLVRKKAISHPSLEVRYGHDGIRYLKDIQYIPRMIRKLSKDLSKRRHDIDWLQHTIESFLILNSRFYDLTDEALVRGHLKKYQTFPDQYSIKPIFKRHEQTLSWQYYHTTKDTYRNRATHDSIHSVVGVPEFKNDTLMKPISYKPTSMPPMYNMAKRKDLIAMWQRDMAQCADDIDAIFNDVVEDINQYKSLPAIESEPLVVLREGKTHEEFNAAFDALVTKHETTFLKKAQEQQAAAAWVEYHQELDTLHDEYYETKTKA